MKFLSLVFNYDFDKMINSGRIWAKSGYNDADYIFEYSAASIATVLHHNPDIEYEIWTDSPELLRSKIEKYNVPLDKLFILNKTKEISQFSVHPYCFWPAVKIVDEYMNEQSDVIKLDNDLTCLKPCHELFTHDGALVWKFERICSAGRDYWGESYAAKQAYGTADFPIYNIGVFAISKNYHQLAKTIPVLCEDMLNVDISKIVRFTEDPNIKVKMWSCSEQTADSYFLWKNNIPVKETYEWFNHHCYSKSKQGCIDAAKFLLKSQ